VRRNYRLGVVMGNAFIGRPVRILMVEDNPRDVDLAREALKDGKVTNILDVATDGEQALARLRREGEFGDAARPDLILLDLNLPGQSGLDVLEVVRQDPKLASIPVVILTASQEEADVHRAYRLSCNCYITKPVDREQLVTIIDRIGDFWLTVVTLPAVLRQQTGPAPPA